MSYRLIDHEPEGRADKVSAMRGHSVAEQALSDGSIKLTIEVGGVS